jgi:uncharacterized phiE125 gp8 family phage protein
MTVACPLQSGSGSRFHWRDCEKAHSMYLLTAPAAEPVTLEEAKLAARISDTAMDMLIPGLITAARELAEQETSAKFMEQTWRTELADWPAATDVLPIDQATAAAVSYWTGTAWSTADGIGTVLAPATGTSWPTLGERPVGARVRIDLTTGAEDAAAVPEAVKLFIKACVAYWIDNPQAASATGVALPMHLGHLLDRQRLYY